MKKLITAFIITLCLTISLTPMTSQASDDQNTLETLFNKLCGQTENAATLPVKEITTMISQCDSLKEKISQSTHPKKKVLLFRLKKCRNFLDFIIQTKQLQPAKH